MIDRKTLTIADIQTSDLLYYDPDLKEKCYQFCKDRDIDCLPSVDDPKTVYLRDDIKRNFQPAPATKDRSVNGETSIFDPDMLERFRQQHLLMVYHGNDLTGVVHFSDYNKPVVSIYLYELFLSYEKTLRNLLIQSGKNNADMIAYFEEKKAKEQKSEVIVYLSKKINDYHKEGSKRKVPPFEVFYLTDLTALINHMKIIKITDFSNLRNMVMHANEFVHRQDPTTDDFIFEFEPFEKFFKLAVKLHIDFKRVKNRIAFFG
jgi:hypothetical protein